jgi:hypothetical protein
MVGAMISEQRMAHGGNSGCEDCVWIGRNKRAATRCRRGEVEVEEKTHRAFGYAAS